MFVLFYEITFIINSASSISAAEFFNMSNKLYRPGTDRDQTTGTGKVNVTAGTAHSNRGDVVIKPLKNPPFTWKCSYNPNIVFSAC